MHHNVGILDLFVPEVINEVASSFTSCSFDGQIANEELLLNPSSLKKRKIVANASF